MTTPLLKICVCGAGTMGSGIAQTFAQNGFDVILLDLNAAALASARKKIELDLQALIDKKKIWAEDRISEKIEYTSLLADCIADVVIEAVVEDSSIKAALLNQLAAINKESTVFATNTSSLSVTAIAENFPRPAKLAGMHFFNPATVMKLIEVVKTKYSSDETVNMLVSLTEQIGKTAVVCNDAPGFIVNHVARPFYLEALHLVEHHHAANEAIDALMEASGFKMGPFRLMDLIGNDINYSVSCIVYEALGKPARLKPSPLQKEKVDKGELGRKTGRGYYAYNQ